MALRARLDFDLVYWGPEEVAELGPEDVPAPDAAIRPGAYRWQPPKVDDAGKQLDCGYWAPLAPQQVKQVPGAPTLEQAFADLAQQISDTGGALPKRTAAWLDEFKKTIDERGAKA